MQADALEASAPVAAEQKVAAAAEDDENAGRADAGKEQQQQQQQQPAAGRAPLREQQQQQLQPQQQAEEPARRQLAAEPAWRPQDADAEFDGDSPGFPHEATPGVPFGVHVTTHFGPAAFSPQRPGSGDGDGWLGGSGSPEPQPSPPPASPEPQASPPPASPGQQAAARFAGLASSHDVNLTQAWQSPCMHLLRLLLDEGGRGLTAAEFRAVVSGAGPAPAGRRCLSASSLHILPTHPPTHPPTRPMPPQVGGLKQGERGPLQVLYSLLLPGTTPAGAMQAMGQRFICLFGEELRAGARPAPLLVVSYQAPSGNLSHTAAGVQQGQAPMFIRWGLRWGAVDADAVVR